MIEQLRSLVFPPDPSVARELHARLRDVQLDPSRRFDVLATLQSLIVNGRAPPWQAADFQTALDLAGSMRGSLRRSVLDIMSEIQDPSTVQPLISLLRNDADYMLRIDAARMLGRNFAGDPAARSALEAAVGTDASLLVREVARGVVAGNPMTGTEDWRPLVISTLDNQNLSPGERIEPLMYVSQTALSTGSSGGGTSRGSGIFLAGGTASVFSDEVAQSAVRMISGLTADQRNLEATVRLLQLLGQSNHPAVRDLMLQLVRNPVEGPGTSAAAGYFFREYCSSREMRQLLEQAADRNAYLRANMTIECTPKQATTSPGPTH